MLEVYEWINIMGLDDMKSNSINEIKNKINTYMDGMQFYCDYHMSLDFYNGNLCLIIHIYSDINMREIEEVMHLTKYICKIAKDSYGILQIYDDESINSPNEFVNYFIQKGEIIKKKDDFLSPVDPTLYFIE